MNDERRSEHPSRAEDKEQLGRDYSVCDKITVGDPIGYGDGMNMYNYVGSDPVNFVDPTGMKMAVAQTGDGTQCLVEVNGSGEITHIYECGAIYVIGERGGGGVDAGRILDTPSERPQSELKDVVCGLLAKLPEDGVKVKGGGDVGLGLVVGGDNILIVERSGRISWSSSFRAGFGIAGRANVASVGTNEGPPINSRTSRSYGVADVDAGVSFLSLLRGKGLSAAIGAKLGAIAAYMDEVTETQTAWDLDCNGQ